MSSYSRYLQQKNSSAIKKYSDYEAYIARKNFDHFCCCLQGGTGPSGAVGLFGGTSIKYSNPSTEGWNNVITPPTGPSQGIRGNNIDATQITKIYASRNDGDNTDVMDVLKILATVKNYEKGIIKITKIDDSSKFIIMKVITVVEQTDYIEYDGSIVMATSSTPFITGEAVVLTITSNGSSDIRNELTNENHEFFPLILRDDATITGSTGATGYTYDGLTINASTKAVSFIGASSANPNNWSTVFQPGANGTKTALNIFASNNYNTSSGMPSTGQINIGKQNNIPFSIDHYGSTKISTAVPSFSGATGPQAQFILNNTDGILLSTKQQEFTTTATPPDNQQIRVYSNFGNIYLNSTGKGVTGNAVAQGGLFLDSRTVDTTTELSKRENIRQPLYLQAAIDPGPSSQISVDRISGLQMAARTYDTNGTTGGTVQIISQTVDTSRSTSGTNSRAADIKRQIQEQQIIIENAETGDADGLAQAQAAKSILETQRATYNTGDPEYSELTAKIDYQQTIITRESRVEDTVTLNAAIAQVVKLENDLRNLPTGAFTAGAKVEPTPKIMGRLAMDNMGNVTLFSGGYTGASGANRQEGKLTLQVAGASGSMELFNEGASGLNITNMGIDGLNLTNTGASGMNLSSVNSLKLSCGGGAIDITGSNINIGSSSSVVDISGQIILNNVSYLTATNITVDNVFIDNLHSNPQNSKITLNDDLDVNQKDISNCDTLTTDSIYQNNGSNQIIIGNFINGSSKYIKFGNKIALHTASSITNANNELNGSNPNNYLIGYRDTDICGGLIYRADVGSGAMNKLVTTTSLHRFSTNFFRTLTNSNTPSVVTGGTFARFSPPFNYTSASPSGISKVYRTLFYNTDQLILNPGVKNWWPGSRAYRSAQNPTENTPPSLYDPGTILPMKFLQLSKNQFIRVLNFTFEGYNNYYQINYSFMGVGNRLYFEIIFGFGNTRAFETGPYTTTNAINFQKCYQVNTEERTVVNGGSNSLRVIDLSLNTVHYSSSPTYPKIYQQIPIENKAIPTTATNGTTEYYSLAPMIFIRAMNPATNEPHTFSTLNTGTSSPASTYTWQIINNTSGNPGNQKEALSDLPWTCPFGAQFMFEHSIPAVN